MSVVNSFYTVQMVQVCLRFAPYNVLHMLAACLLLLQPNTAIANQLPGHLVYTQIRTIGLNCFKFIIELIVPSTRIV